MSYTNPFQMMWRMGFENKMELSHAIQCANLARKNNHRKNIVLACLFHDIGNYNTEKKYTPLKNHEYLGYGILKKNGFDEEICQYVKNHVLSKRYLCTADKRYYELLPEKSKKSFKLQGGFLTDTQMSIFEKSKYFAGSILVRSYDDIANKPENKSLEDLYIELQDIAILYKEK